MFSPFSDWGSSLAVNYAAGRALRVIEVRIMAHG